MEAHLNSAPHSANLGATAILDIDHEEIRKLAQTFTQSTQSGRRFLQAAHGHLVQNIRPVYSVDEQQSASITLRKGRGSCSQRMACLEALARANGIPTRVRAFRVKGSFWYPRFGFLRRFIPKRILLVWPQFFIEQTWVDFDELYAPLAELSATAAHGFTNEGESLFEAVRNTPVDFLGKTCGLSCAKPDHNLSKFIVADEGFFDIRDHVFQRLGTFQTSWRGHIFQLLFLDCKSC